MHAWLVRESVVFVEKSFFKFFLDKTAKSR